MRGKDEVSKHLPELRTGLKDESPHVRIAAAEALGVHGTDADAQAVMPLLVDLADATKSNAYASIHALNAISAMGKKALPWKARILASTGVDGKAPERVRTEYGPKLLKRLGEVL